MTFDLYAWTDPRDLDADEAAARIAAWEEAGADPAVAPFEPSTNVTWFYRELLRDSPGIDVVSDAAPLANRRPIVLQTDEPPPAHVVGIRLRPGMAREDLDTIFGLAAKYDLVLFEPQGNRLHLPLEELASYASATFWPRGAIRAFVAGAVGALLAIVAWALGVPILSGAVAVVGGFLFVMAVYTFVHEGRVWWRARRREAAGPGAD
jgi:hypothetical protein